MPYRDEAQAERKRATSRLWWHNNRARGKAAQRARYAATKEAHKAKAAVYRSDPVKREEAKLRSQEWRERNQHRKREYNRAAYLKSAYGLDWATYQRMLDNQGGLCAVCHEEMPEQWRCVDHDHVTGVVRAILCSACNSLIGLAREQPEILRAAADYVELHKQRRSRAEVA